LIEVVGLFDNTILETRCRSRGKISAVGSDHGVMSFGIDARAAGTAGVVDLTATRSTTDDAAPRCRFPVDRSVDLQCPQAIGNGIPRFFTPRHVLGTGLRSGNNATRLLEAIETLRPQLARIPASTCA